MLIGFLGKARSGKDTFAEMLAKELFGLTRQRYVLMAFAHELKVKVQKDFDMSYEQLWGDGKEKQHLRYARYSKGFSSNPTDYWTPREILQSYGEFYRSIDYNFWVNYLFELIEDKEYKNIIITDVRYINEADIIMDKGGSLIKMVRDIDNNVHGQAHISEVELDNYNTGLIVKNNETLKDLKLAAKNVAKKLIKESDNG
jgi:hypothetical protein